MLVAVTESLARIEVKLASLDTIQARLSALEQKVEAIIAPPRAFKPRDAGKLLGCSASKVKELVKAGKLRAVPVGDREHIPLSELVRLTSVTSPVRRAAPGPRSPPLSGKTEAEKIRAALRKK